MQFNQTRAGIFTLLKLHKMLFSLTRYVICILLVSYFSFIGMKTMAYLSTFSAQAATMTDSNIKHANYRCRSTGEEYSNLIQSNFWFNLSAALSQYNTFKKYTLYKYLPCTVCPKLWSLSCLEFKFDDIRLSYWFENKIGRIEIFFLLPDFANFLPC